MAAPFWLDEHGRRRPTRKCLKGAREVPKLWLPQRAPPDGWLDAARAFSAVR